MAVDRSFQAGRLRGFTPLLRTIWRVMQMYTDPLQDAKVLTAITGRMEYRGLLDNAPPDADGEMFGILTRFMQWVLA